jgi:hypothetical protein
MDQAVSSVASELLNEIERVSAKRGRWRGYAGLAPKANFGPAIMLMTIAIDNAKKAIMGEDPVAAIAALRALRDFNEED